MLFLEQLLEQMDVAGGILAEQGVSSLCQYVWLVWHSLDIGLSSMVDIEQANRKATGNYISMLLIIYSNLT